MDGGGREDEIEWKGRSDVSGRKNKMWDGGSVRCEREER